MLSYSHELNNKSLNIKIMRMRFSWRQRESNPHIGTTSL